MRLVVGITNHCPVDTIEVFLLTDPPKLMNGLHWSYRDSAHGHVTLLLHTGTIYYCELGCIGLFLQFWTGMWMAVLQCFSSISSSIFCWKFTLELRPGWAKPVTESHEYLTWWADNVPMMNPLETHSNNMLKSMFLMFHSNKIFKQISTYCQSEECQSNKPQSASGEHPCEALIRDLSHSGMVNLQQKDSWFGC